MMSGNFPATKLVRIFALTVAIAASVACSDAGPPASSMAGGGTSGGGQASMSGSSAVSGASGSVASSAGTAAQTGGASHGGGAGAGGSNGGASSQAGTGTSGTATDGGAGPGPGGGEAAVIAAGVRWVGRADVSDPNAVQFAWSGSGFVGTFSGASVSVKLRTEGSGDIYFQPVVDGVLGARFAVSGAEQAYEIASNLSAGPHEVELYRESEGKGLGYSVFTGFAAGAPGTPPPFSGRLIEVIGDSISAGYGNLGMEQHQNGAADPNGGCRFETKTESAYQAYSHVAARSLDADASVLAGSGWGVYSDNEGNTKNVMSALFSNAVGEKTAPAWSFAAQPQAVVINLGTNDASAKNLTAEKFKPAYATFLTTVRAKYPEALILCAVGSMIYGADRDNALLYLGQIVADRAAEGDKKVEVLDLGSQDANKGTGCDWHPNVAEDARMAAVLAAKLKTSLGW
jgi:lysophospholipase L1-like esterase